MGQSQSLEFCLIPYPPHAAVYMVEHQPEIVIDNSLVQFSGLDSTNVLQGYMSSVDANQLSGYTERLGSALGGLESVPNAVGLGTLVISMILELFVGKKDEMSTRDILCRVFAEEKASEIRDLMDEYLRRLEINLRNTQLQLEDTRRIEAMLSLQLTRAKNSMLKDGHMSTRALSHWVNGAAFHTQMLIHQACLEAGDGARATAAVDLYQKDLSLLTDNYRTHVPDFSRQVETDGQDISNVKCNLELEGPKQYFLSVKRDIPALIRQHNTFNVMVSS